MFIYLSILGQLLLLAWGVVLCLRHSSDPRGNWRVVAICYGLCVFPVLMLWTAFDEAGSLLGSDRVVVNGYTFDSNEITIGSARSNDLILNSVYADEEQFAREICRLKHLGNGTFRVTLLTPPEGEPGNANAVSLNNPNPDRGTGTRLGAIRLKDDGLNTIAINGREGDVFIYIEKQDDLKGIPRVWTEADGKEFHDDTLFGHRYPDWELPSYYRARTSRMHLRFRLPSLRPYLGESSLKLRYDDPLPGGALRNYTPLDLKKVHYDFEPNGLDVTVNGEPAPREKVFSVLNEGGYEQFTEIWFSTKDYSSESVVVRMQLGYDIDGGIKLFYLEKEQPSHVIIGDRPLALTSETTPFRNVQDVLSPNFPREPFVMFPPKSGRVKTMSSKVDVGIPFKVGNASLTVTNDHRTLYPVFIYGCLALVVLCVGLFPYDLVRHRPLLAMANGAVVMVAAFRCVLAVRVWAGPPYADDSVLIESVYGLLVIPVIYLSLLPEMYKNFIYFWNRLTGSKQQAGSVHLRPSHLYPWLFWCSAYIAYFIVFLSRIEVLVVGSVFMSTPLFRALLATAFNNLRFSLDFNEQQVYFLVGLALVFAALAPVLFKAQERLFGFPVNPFFRLLLVVTYAWWLGRQKHAYVSLWAWGCLAVLIALLCARGFLAKDFGTIILGAVPLVLLAGFRVARNPLSFVSYSLLALLGVVGIVYMVVHARPDWMPELFTTRIAFLAAPEMHNIKYFLNFLDQTIPLWHAAQSESIFGAGLFQGFFDYSVRNTSLCDYLASVWIMGEFGMVGVLLVYVALICIPLLLLIAHKGVRARGDMKDYRFLLLFGVSWMFIWPTLYMFLANLRFLPLTGKDLPFLALNAMGNPIFYGLLFGIGVRQVVTMHKGLKG